MPKPSLAMLPVHGSTHSLLPLSAVLLSSLLPTQSLPTLLHQLHLMGRWTSMSQYMLMGQACRCQRMSLELGRYKDQVPRHMEVPLLHLKLHRAGQLAEMCYSLDRRHDRHQHPTGKLMQIVSQIVVLASQEMFRPMAQV